MLILYGAFHIMIAYSISIGFFIDGSGGDTIIIGIEILVSGSLKEFLYSKCYNRCKRLHLMLATALQSLHFRISRDEYGNLFKDIDKLLPELAEYPTFVNLSKIECSQKINKLHRPNKKRASWGNCCLLAGVYRFGEWVPSSMQGL